MTTSSSITVAFLGLGRMGSRMATNVAAAGYDVVVHNRTRATADKLAVNIIILALGLLCSASARVSGSPRRARPMRIGEH